MISHHSHQNAFESLNARKREGLMLVSRRNAMKIGVAGLAGLTLPDLIRVRTEAATRDERSPPARASSCSGWPAGRATSTPGPEARPAAREPWPVRRHRDEAAGRLRLRAPAGQAAMLDKFTIIRSVDCRHCNHEPNKVFQTANLDAEPRENREAELYPRIGSIVAKLHGANHPACRRTSRSRRRDRTSPTAATWARHTTRSSPTGRRGCRSTPTWASTPADITEPTSSSSAAGLSHERIIGDRRALLDSFDRLARTI